MLAMIPFRRIPHQSELFLEYLDLSPRALEFYARPPTLESLAARAGEVRRSSTPRREMAAILRRQNAAFGSGPRAAEHIGALEGAESVAVVTGQQVGLFSGPLYTIYKALTAVRLAADLERRGIPAVPVFWMDSEDHDLAEVTKVALFGRDGTPRRIDGREILFGAASEDNARPVGDIVLTDATDRLLELFHDSLPETLFRAEVAARLRAAYRPGATFALAFGRWLADLFRERGLVLFDPHDPASKPLLGPLFEQAVIQAETIQDALVERNRRLESSGFHAQVHVLEGSTVLFLESDGQRRAVARQGDGFALKGSSLAFSRAELARLAASSPERFSPNVLLRPIAQDSLLPTAAYIAGPSEIAYFAQIHALYPIFGRPMPVIWPRASFTLLPPEIAAELDRYGLGLEDCFAGKHRLVEKLIAASNQSSTASILAGLESYLDAELEALRPALVAAEASLGPALETAKRKILHQVGVLETKFVHLETRRNRTILEKADALLDCCYPNRNLQEREVNVAYFLARQGFTLLDSVYSSIEPGRSGHGLLRLQ